jgi:predicted DNA binding protein
MLQQAEFSEIALVAETGFNSSSKTKGVLIRAKKPIAEQKQIKPIKVTVFENSKSDKEGRRRDFKIEDILNKAFELGAEKAKVVDTDTVVVEEWVRWKCQYGCALYEKDGFHPPLAPDAETTKKILKEYSKAILINGPKGKALTEIALRLEGEAYNMGFYKAIALTALSSGPAGST